MRRKYTLKDNIRSFLIGCIIAIPICICSKSYDQPVTVEPLKIETPELVPVDESTQIVIESTAEIEETEEDVIEPYELLAVCVMAEAGNQDLMGKRMVVDVILNRVDDPEFPDTIVGVITQPYHFSSYWDGAMDRAIPNEDCYTAIDMELKERSYPGLFYFTAGRYSDYGTPWKQYGDHYFSTK